MIATARCDSCSRSPLVVLGAGCPLFGLAAAVGAGFDDGGRGGGGGCGGVGEFSENVFSRMGGTTGFVSWPDGMVWFG